MPATQSREWVQRLHSAGSVRPTAACSSRHTHHRDGAISQRMFAQLPPYTLLLRIASFKVIDAVSGYVFNLTVYGQAILRKSDAPAAHVAANLLMLLAVESVSAKQLIER